MAIFPASLSRRSQMEGATDNEPLSDAAPLDASHFLDADWVTINEFKRVCEAGGRKALNKALADLAKRDPISYVSIVAAYLPEMISETNTYLIAESEMAEDEVREILQSLEVPTVVQ